LNISVEVEIGFAESEQNTTRKTKKQIHNPRIKIEEDSDFLMKGMFEFCDNLVLFIFFKRKVIKKINQSICKYEV